jgi:hypothetical protein
MNINPNEIIQELAQQNAGQTVEIIALQLAVQALEAQVVALTPVEEEEIDEN